MITFCIILVYFMCDAPAIFDLQIQFVTKNPTNPKNKFEFPQNMLVPILPIYSKNWA